MNDLISQQLPQLDPATVQQHGRQPGHAVRAVPAVAKTDRSSVDADTSRQRGGNAADPDKLSEVVKELNMKLEEMQRSLRFSVDDSSGRIVVQVIDLGTDEVIRQIPSEEMMAIIRNASENQGVMFDQEA